MNPRCRAAAAAEPQPGGIRPQTHPGFGLAEAAVARGASAAEVPTGPLGQRERGAGLPREPAAVPRGPAATVGDGVEGSPAREVHGGLGAASSESYPSFCHCRREGSAWPCALSSFYEKRSWGQISDLWPPRCPSLARPRRPLPECSSFTSEDMVLVMESAATSRSLRRFLLAPVSRADT